MTTIAPLAPAHLWAFTSPQARTHDPITSKLCESVEAAKRAQDYCWLAFRTGRTFTDDELAITCRAMGAPCSAGRIRHGRLELQRQGLIRDTGQTRPTEIGGESRVWIRSSDSDTTARTG